MCAPIIQPVYKRRIQINICMVEVLSHFSPFTCTLSCDKVFRWYLTLTLKGLPCGLVAWHTKPQVNRKSTCKVLTKDQPIEDILINVYCKIVLMFKQQNKISKGVREVTFSSLTWPCMWRDLTWRDKNHNDNNRTSSPAWHFFSLRCVYPSSISTIPLIVVMTCFITHWKYNETTQTVLHNVYI